MSDDYKQGYRDGFKDGMEAAKNQTLLPTNYSLPPVKRCPVCGIDYTTPMSYVCYNQNCPSNIVSFKIG